MPISPLSVPPADSGYLAVTDSQSWPVGAEVLEKNFALDKGRIVRGQLIDADTRQPIAGAAVVYQPTRDNPNNRKYDLRNTVLTNAEGRFAITALPGQGSLAVETADESYIRVPFDESYPYRTIAYPQGLARIDVSQRRRTGAGADHRAERNHARGKGDRPRW